MKPPLLLFAVLAASLLSPGCVPERPDHRPQIDGRVLDAQGALALNARVFACTSFGKNSIARGCDEEAFVDSGSEGTFKLMATVGEERWHLLLGDPASPFTLVVACSEGLVGATLARGAKPLQVDVKLAESLPEETRSVGKDSYLGAHVTEEDIRAAVARLCGRPGG
ncbi:MAG: hypothetical protein AUK47_28900 [Deltaproteobacteria bacterium CG2_30_63_29]|nr:MAG: hypothetical protein AUK47_28900 [Deltaproteobacteria bacterium CG2_30_63_29]PJB38716.1 MAG: hypothetical protein CO108_18500 [Deltaproteobacteria bacterium CG_4_9_14_3_um_filter_63_12]